MENTQTGKIIKGIGGFYYVDVGGESQVIECRACGRFRHEGVVPLVGDNAVIKDAYVLDILPRKNSLIRPKVANVDKAVITFSVKNPKINTDILDRFLILTAEAGVEAVICINKAELDNKSAIKNIREIYENSGCDFLEISAVNKTGIDKIADCIAGCTAVFAGPSGVGKSTIINILANAEFKTGEISTKISRGKHTTRESVLIATDRGGYVVDTPGFTSLSLAHIKKSELSGYFNEFAPFVGECRFSECSHINEPANECGVKPRAGNEIRKERYDCYVRLYNEFL